MAAVTAPSRSDMQRILQSMSGAIDAQTKKAGGPTEQERLRAGALAALDALGGLSVTEDSVTFTGSKFVCPEQFGGDYLAAAKFLQALHKQEEQEFNFGRAFQYRWADGAAAFNRALMRVFGTTGLGKVTKGGMFSPDRPPQLRSVHTSATETIQVPWGEVVMPPLESTFNLSVHNDEEFGMLFYLDVTAPRRMRRRLEAFFDVVQDELAKRSIYRGKAFTAASEPRFLDLSWVKPEKVVYSGETLAQLDANVWTVIRHAEEMRRLGLPVKRSVIVEGPYGTGKSLAGALTAIECQQAGWTFVQVRPGVDDMFQALKTAQLYAPAVVLVEDLDVIASGGDEEAISRLLDALDGIGNKGNGVMLLATTNHINKLQKAVMRPGRTDAIIHIGGLDRTAVEKLIRVTVAPELLGDIDYDKAYAALEGFLPAFIAEALGRATRYSLSRNGGRADLIHTEDIVYAAAGLRIQLDLMNGANEGVKALPTLDARFVEIVAQGAAQGVAGTELIDYDGDYDGKLVPAGTHR